MLKDMSPILGLVSHACRRHFMSDIVSKWWCSRFPPELISAKKTKNRRISRLSEENTQLLGCHKVKHQPLFNLVMGHVSAALAPTSDFPQ